MFSNRFICFILVTIPRHTERVIRNDFNVSFKDKLYFRAWVYTA